MQVAINKNTITEGLLTRRCVKWILQVFEKKFEQKDSKQINHYKNNQH